MSSEELQLTSEDGSNAFHFWKEKDVEASAGNSISGVSVKQTAAAFKSRLQRDQSPFNPHSSITNGSSFTTTTALLGGGEGRLKLRPTQAGLGSGSKRRPPPPRPLASPTHHPAISADYTPASSFSLPCTKSSTKSSSVDIVRNVCNELKSSRHSSQSDAGSYTPRGGSVFSSASLKEPAKHKKANKSSSPELHELPPQSRTTTLSQSSKPVVSLERSSQLRAKKFVPRISTIRGSTGDRLSVDDLDLYHLQKTGKVSGLAKQINSALLSPQQSSRTRHGSIGEVKISNMVRVQLIFIVGEVVWHSRSVTFSSF